MHALLIPALAAAFWYAARRSTPKPGGSEPLGFLPNMTGGGSGAADWIRSVSGWAGDPLLDPTPLVDVQDSILAAFDGGEILWPWSVVRYSVDGHTVEVPVTADCMKIGVEGDAIRAAVTGVTAQAIADRLGCSLLTSRVSDAIWNAARVKLTPTTLVANETDLQRMATLGYMIKASKIVDQKCFAKEAGNELIGNGGKDWILTKRWAEAPSQRVPNPPAMAANYGLYDANASSWNPEHTLRLIQPIGLRHEPNHVDYSQQMRVMGPTCIIDGTEYAIADVLVDPALASCLSAEGVLPWTRTPSLPAA